MTTTYASIWQDIFYRGDTAPLSYNITLDGNVIYSGRAYPKPDTGLFTINISKICQDYLSNTLTNDWGGYSNKNFSHPYALRVFTLTTSTGSALAEYHFLYCWDYRTRYANTDTVLSSPVNGKYTANMKLFRTTVSGGTVTTVMKTDEKVEGYTEESCGNGAIYYKNRAGGWDSFLIEGTVRRTDNYSKYTYNRSFNNNSMEFEEGTYHNEISSTWNVHTGWLSDEQAETLAFHLMSSNSVYFHNFKDGSIVPVIITDTSAEYKTYRTNGYRMVAYDIELTESQKKQLL